MIERRRPFTRVRSALCATLALAGSAVLMPSPARGDSPKAPTPPSAPTASSPKSASPKLASPPPPAQKSSASTGAYEKVPKQPGVVKLKRGSKVVTITVRKDGKVTPEALEALSDVFQHKSGAKHAVPPALADLIASTSDHFGGRTLEIVGAYRPPPGHSNHNTGKAIDFRIENVPALAVRDFCQTLPGAGVGFYPKAKFVHLDVRARAKSWTDESSGEPTKPSQGSKTAAKPQ